MSLMNYSRLIIPATALVVMFNIAKYSCLVKFLSPRLDGHLADLDEVIVGKGDGAVAVKRGRLHGVTDVTLIDVHHLRISSTPQTRAERELQREILKRLLRSLR